ncbi:PIN domain-containing protein [Methylomonas sp. AM2-LC]|uniref:type II toxin-antitoxin system VapC family toxin n=1 Tax=Methylomonas sp. AM2-LC TaxID=3153301 RepID=UPI003263808B
MIIADTGFWVAILDDSDNFHDLALQVAKTLQEPLITTIPVITEVCYLLQKRRGERFATAFLRSHHRSAFRLFDITASHLFRCEELMSQYADLPMDFADASLVVLAEHLGHGRIVSTDKRDFGAYRWKNRQPFQNLLEND